MTLNNYINIVNQRFFAGNATEHSYRGDLQQLLQTMLPDVAVTNEPKRIDCGAPDYILSRKDIPVGYIEAKDIGIAIDSKASKKDKEQFDRYKSALDNLIITDYLQFHFYKQGQLVASCFIGEISNGKVHANPQNFDTFTSLIQNFALTVTQSIKSPVKLAQMMAAKAKLMADVIDKALNEDKENNSQSDLYNQYEAFKTVLIHDISHAEFADIYAQTIAYGMFAARYHDPTLPTFTRHEAATLIPQSNPFLRQLFRTVAGYNLDDTDGKRLLWIVEELVQIFLATDVASIMRNFGKATRQQDPVVHFYETFLAEYDPKLRKARGVWYTPEPVVNFIVRAVDDILKTKFNLPKGLADTSKTQITVDVQGAGKKGKTEKLTKEIHKVQILDPATGTGTFLAQTVRHIYNTQFASMQGMWPQYVKEHLIPRLNGFELLMTSYAMAHLKLDMLLTETGAYAATPPSAPLLKKGNQTNADFIPLQNEGVARSDGVVKTTDQRLRIYLTNSLENDDAPDLPLFSYLSNEANEANRIKRDAPVMVVMGNPPYSVSSSNKSAWIQDLLKDYKKDLNERKINLDDDYIKFIRFGQHFIDKNGEGVLAYISNNSFINGITHRQMRKHLLESFDEIYILDLHGDSRKKESSPDGSKDENVFDIMQGVSINLFVKTGQKAKVALGNVFHYELYGKRENKYETLNQTTIASLPWQQLDLKTPYNFFVPKDFVNEHEYEKGLKVSDLFKENNSGVKTDRDSLFIDINARDLDSRINQLLSGQFSSEFKKTFRVEDSGSYKLIGKLKSKKFSSDYIKEILYRPFDYQWIYYDENIISRHGFSVFKNVVNNPNYVLCTSRSIPSNQSFDRVFISKNLVDIHSASDQTYAFPLYIYPDSADLLAETTRTPNLNMQMVETIASQLGVTFTAEKTTTPPAGHPFEPKGNQNHVPNSPSLEGVARSDRVVVMARSDGVATTHNKLSDLPYNPALKEKARELRKAGNLSEVLFWNAVKNKQLDDLDFDRQRVIGNYIVDFYCHKHSLVVEIDGSSHDDKQEYDVQRDAYLRGLGLNVLHVQDIDVKKNLSGVMYLVKQHTVTSTRSATATTPSSLCDATPSNEGELKSFAPIDLLDYIYAVLHSPTYRETYKEFLKIDFPRVPYPSNVSAFWQLVKLGGQLRQTHLLESVSPSPIAPLTKGEGETISYPIGGNNIVDKLRFESPSSQPSSASGRGSLGRVYINATQYFDNVPHIAWGFYIGGYQPAQKWLKDRKGRTLNVEDITHYQKIVNALIQTDLLMLEIDAVFSIA